MSVVATAKPPMEPAWQARLCGAQMPYGIALARIATGRHDGVHDPPRQQREQPGDAKRTGEDQPHDAAMIDDLMPMRLTHRAEP
jgi:hypothetical protein